MHRYRAPAQVASGSQRGGPSERIGVRAGNAHCSLQRRTGADGNADEYAVWAPSEILDRAMVPKGYRTRMTQRPEWTAVMVISANYATPVLVNGYLCNNCTQVAEAQKDINPADPQAGPWGVDAKSISSPAESPAFTLGGLLASGTTINGVAPGKPASVASSASPTSTTSSPPLRSSRPLDISV